jgi:hypothetical protein
MEEIKNVDVCLFCKKTKDWNSTIVLKTKTANVEVTVCPNCRITKTILDMNRKITRLFFKKFKKEHD